jgi:hypothetical protein
VTRFLAGFGPSPLKSRAGLAAASAAGLVALGALGVAGWLYQGRDVRAPDTAPPAAAAQGPAETPAAAGTTAAAPAPPPEAPRITPPTAAELAAVLARIPCSALVAAVRGDTVEVEGIVSQAVGAAGVRNMLAALPGVAEVKPDLRQVAPANCPLLAAFAPYWVAHRQAGGGAALRLAGTKGWGWARGSSAANPVLAEGDSLMVDVATPGAGSFMTVDAYLADGTVIHLLPNALALDNRAPPHHRATVGRPGDWTIGKSSGSELVVVLVTTPAPPFDTLRRESEPASAYLADLAPNLARIRASGPGGIGVAILPVTIKPR